MLDQGGRDELHQQRAGEGPEDADPASAERGPADHHGGDGAQLDQEAHERRVGGAEPGRVEDPGQRGQQAADYVDGHQGAPHRQAGEDAGPAVAADRDHAPAEGGAPNDQAHQPGDGRGDQDGDRDPGDPVGPDGRQGGVEQLGEPALGEHQGDAAAGDQQAEGGHDRLHPDEGDQAAVDEPDHAAREQGDRDRHPGAVAEVQGEQGGGDGHGRPDRQVDALGADDQGHAQGDDGHRDHLDELQAQVADGGEVGREGQVEGHQQGQGHVHAPVPEPAAQVPAGRERAGQGGLIHRRRSRRPARPGRSAP